ncbi:TPA: hypothetical protein I7114_04400 [Vibrio vulnificus]|nr:hypothetical protein [Vibrio vulnificus]
MYLVKSKESQFKNYNSVRALLYCFGEQSHHFIEKTCLLSEYGRYFCTWELYEEFRQLKHFRLQYETYLQKLEQYNLATRYTDFRMESTLHCIVSFMCHTYPLTVTFESEKLTVNRSIYTVTKDCTFDEYLDFLRNIVSKQYKLNQNSSANLFKLLLNSFDDNGTLKKAKLKKTSLKNNLNECSLNNMAKKYYKSHLFINKDKHTIELDQTLLSLNEIREKRFDKHTFTLTPLDNGEVEIEQIYQGER